MNERIFELAKQANLIQWDTLPSGARTPDHESVVKAMMFAKLIVQDCVSEVALMGVTNFENEDISWACRVIIDGIKSKFGV